VYNVVVAECLRGIVFNEIGDYINLCLKMDGPHKPSMISNIATNGDASYFTSSPLCFTKAKARVVATSRKFPGFFKFSGYKQMNLICPDIVMTKK
jgi:poly-beta-hydroxyalkanoate depolymerase